MAIGFGHQGYLGFKTEATWGTRVAADKFLRILGERFKLDQKNIPKPTLATTSQNRKVKSIKTVNGGFDCQFGFNGLETILTHAIGSVGSANVTGSVYLHTYTLANALPVGFTCHVSPDSAAVGTAYEYEGCQVSKLTLKQDMEDMLIASVDCEAEDEAIIAAISPTYPTFSQADYTQLGVTLNSAATDVHSLEWTIENPLATDRRKLGSRLRKGLGRSGVRRIYGKLEKEFDSQTEYDLFRNLTEVPLLLVWGGANITGGHDYTFTISMPKVTFSGATHNFSEAGPIMLPLDFEAFANTDAGLDEISVTLKNTVASAA